MKKYLPVPVILVALLIAGCGSDDSGSETAGPLTRDEFIAQADQICEAESQAAEEELADYPEDPTEDEIRAAVTEIVVPSIDRQLESIGALEFPEGDEEEVGEILDQLREANDAVREDPLLVNSPVGPFEEASQLAADYGMLNCSE